MSSFPGDASGHLNKLHFVGSRVDDVKTLDALGAFLPTGARSRHTSTYGGGWREVMVVSLTIASSGAAITLCFVSWW